MDEKFSLFRSDTGSTAGFASPVAIDNPPEVVAPHSTKEVFFRTTTQETSLESYAQPEKGSDQDVRRGLSRRFVWAAVVLVIVVIGASVGGGIGGSLAIQKAKSNSNPGASISTPQPYTLTSPTTTNPTSTPSNSSSITTYVPPSPADVDLIDNSCPSTSLFSSSPFRDAYNCTESSDLKAPNLSGLVAYTVQACVDACSIFNDHVNDRSNGSADLCKAVFISRNLKESFLAYGANCWLKGTAAPMQPLAQGTVLVLQ